MTPALHKARRRVVIAEEAFERAVKAAYPVGSSVIYDQYDGLGEPGQHGVVLKHRSKGYVRVRNIKNNYEEWIIAWRIE